MLNFCYALTENICVVIQNCFEVIWIERDASGVGGCADGLLGPGARGDVKNVDGRHVGRVCSQDVDGIDELESNKNIKRMILECLPRRYSKSMSQCQRACRTMVINDVSMKVREKLTVFPVQ